MDHMDNQYCRPGFFSYLLARIASFFVANIIFCRRFLRNELKSVRGPCVVIANHECALDFVNLIGATRRPMTFVIRAMSSSSSSMVTTTYSQNLSRP